jgi:MFS family permease
MATAATIEPIPEHERAQTFMRALPPLLALALAMAVAFTMMTSFSTVQEGAKAEMGLSDQALSLIQGLSAAVPLFLLSIPIGIAVDRGNRVRLMIGLALVWTAGTLLTAMAANVTTLFVARMLAGIGASGALTCALSLLADLCAPAQRGRAALVVTFGKSLGQAASFALTGLLFGWFALGAVPQWFGPIAPWRSAHYALAIISAVSILPLLLLKEPARREVEAGPHAPFGIVFRELWSRRGFLIPLFIGQVSVVMADAAAHIWVTPVLSRDFGLQPQEFGGWLGALIFAAGMLGAVFGAAFADLGHKSGRKGGVLLGAVIASAIGIPAALFPIMPSVGSLAVAIGVLMLCGTITGLATSVAMTVLLPNELRGLCIGAFITIAGLVGFGIAPSLVTWVSSLLGGEQHLALALAIVGVTVSVASFFAFLVAMRRAP